MFTLSIIPRLPMGRNFFCMDTSLFNLLYDDVHENPRQIFRIAIFLFSSARVTPPTQGAGKV